MKWHLALLCGGLIAPVLVFVGIVLWEYAAAERARLLHQATSTADAMATAIDRELSTMIGAVASVAKGQSVQSGDLAAFDRRAREALATNGIHVVLRDRTGQQLVNTRVPWGATLPRVPDLEADRIVLETKAPYVSDLLIGAVAQAPVFLVNAPVLREGEVIYFLNFSVPAEHLRDILLKQGLPEGWIGSVIDRKGNIMARTQAHEALVGKPSAPGFMESAPGREGVWRGTSIEGREVVFGYQRADASDWLVGAAMPRAVLEAPLWRGLMLLALLGAMLLFTSVLLTALLGRQMSQALAQLVGSARQIAHGKPVARLATPVSEINAVGDTLADAAKTLRDNEARLKLLTREVDHRAKNMLAVVQVMLRQTRADSAKAYAAAAQGRVAALARAHTLLSQSRWEGADLRRLIEDEMAPYRLPGRVRIVLDGPSVALPPYPAQSLSLALHELATNAAKYGALSVPAGRVTVAWQRASGALALRWTETGGPPVAQPVRRGFGTSVIDLAIRHQLGGEVRFDWRADGLVCTITVPAEPLTQDRSAA